MPLPELTVTTLLLVMLTVFGEQTAGGLVTVICGVGKTVIVDETVELHPVTEVIVHWYVNVPVVVGVIDNVFVVPRTVPGFAVFTQEYVAAPVGAVKVDVPY